MVAFLLFVLVFGVGPSVLTRYERRRERRLARMDQIRLAHELLDEELKRLAKGGSTA